ncbi:MAG: nucleotide exchange factor GrpE, partial [Thermoplasmata archaeon]|nr:nucleotide exchange factor GrpE [Thermoplasmata archaeon]
DIIRTVEDMERALDMPKMKKQDMLKGFEMILKELKTTLEKNGVVVIESVGARFDPDLHEAVLQSCTDCAEDDSMVVEELDRGFMLHDRVIRFAKVKVAKYEEVIE